ncbi:Arc family DNA-binding protein [Acinetobacter guillouiae]|uniref:Arc family DNA-binding protein n=1 Tax=Acinetobacter guillouiae TaxID=106649 RepID=UPI0002D047DB|nr:Arc family DNA-binding protein [Acinetobacter guillouiae]ENU56739.1 hypothetical protein F981_04246 [Acinetobacter guillouiae CIP 63.46]KAB0623678.1 Arc family DNA-binding protein [Acinetobacter guillouiae]
MARNDTQVNIRMPHELVSELKVEAVKHRRSMTAQLNEIVQEWIGKQKHKGEGTV